jgi:hypothetical protein
VSRRCLLVPCLLLVAALAGCGGADSSGEVTLWVTRDRGAEVLVNTTVPGGLTAMQALRRKVDVSTSYGGRFVEAIDGVDSDAGAHRDWFFFVNGIEADRGAAEYGLRGGDVLWWDYRSWTGDAMREPVVVGAFPQPFLSGYGGEKRPAVVRFETKKMRGAALGLANTIGARSVEMLDVKAPAAANVLEIVEDPVVFSAALRTPGGPAGSPVVFRVSFDDAKRLLANPRRAWRRYRGLG